MKKIFHDPHFGAKITWSTRANSQVEIFNHLPLLIDEDYQFVPLTFRIPKEYLPIANDTPVLIPHLAARLLRSISQVKPKSRKRELSFVLSIPCELFPSIHLKLQKGDIILFQKFFNEPLPPPPEPKTTHLELLTNLLGPFFFSSSQLAIIMKPPRGVVSKAFPLTELLPIALLICRELVLKAKKSAENGKFGLWNRIQKIIEEDENLSNFLEGENEHPQVYQDVTTLYLVQRAFQGAWEAYGHPGFLNTKHLLEVEPQNIFRSHLYGKERAAIIDIMRKAKKVRPDIYERVIEYNEKLYLGDPGAATKAFFSIP